MRDVLSSAPHLRRTAPIAALAVMLAAAAPSLAAQSDADKAALTAWVDSVEAASTVEAVDRLEAASKVGEGRVGQLRRAYWVMRHGDLRDNRMEIDEALFAFNSAAAKEGDWPWPEFGLARTLVALELHEYVPKGGNGIRDGESNASAIWRHLANSLDRDADFVPTRDLFLRLALATDDRDQTDLVRRTVHTYASPPISDWRAVLVEGRIARTDDDMPTALARFDSVLVLGGDTALTQLERARTLHALGRTVAARAAYWASLVHPSAAARLAHHIDLWWITTADSLTAFDALPGDSVLPWMQRFWLRRDAENLRAPGERLTEHLRRWNWVRHEYRIPASSRRTEMKRTEFDISLQGQCVPSGAWSLDDLIAEEPHDPGDIRKDERMLDHRAIIYMRHGEPIAKSISSGTRSDVASTSEAPGFTALSSADVSWFIPPVGGEGSDDPTGTQRRDQILRFLHDSAFVFTKSLSAEQLMDERLRQNESWLYWIDGAYRMLHFTGSEALGLQAPTTLNTVLPLRPDLYIARANLDPSYIGIARMLLTPALSKPRACQDEIQQLIKTDRANATVASAEDSYTPTFEKPFVLYSQFYGLGRGNDGSGKALVAFAIPSVGLRTGGNIPDGRLLVPIRFRLTFFDPATGANRFIDTTRTFATRSLDKGTYLSGTFEIPLPSGDWEMGLLAAQDGAGTGGMARQRDIAIGGSGAFTLGDLVMGRESGAPVWNAGGEALPLNPWNAWSRDSQLELWFELRGLAAGAEYSTALEVSPQGRRGRGVKVDWTGRAAGPVTSVRRTVQLKDLDPGSYTVTVTVTANGTSASRERTITVLKEQ